MSRLATRLISVLAALVLAVLGSFAVATPASACSCSRMSDDPALFQQASVVFLGSIVDDRTRGNSRTLTFAVERVFKGAATSLQQVQTQAEPASCGLELQGTGPFVVHARGTASGLAADLCGGTRATVRAGGDPGGYPPMPGGGPPSDAAYPWLRAGTAVALLIGAVGLVAVLRRRSTRPRGC